ncbi:DUF4190 domain-containing protein [Roseimaritima ulvae]|uniref:DUF4190 domain-containing protein n=1 Tax=Roseimaritima ulvae TaxID=980254 RepID=A0A5B9QZ31_9BACT|nr:DUF4190 domain-containing protein [Roseimaritima ulvae]QEG43219.1 hypothetical protein UC8_52650 [Roseimaritima ulvae]
MSTDNPYQTPAGGAAPQNPQLEKEIKSQAVTSLIVGIVSLVCCGIILAPFAIYRGNKAKSLIDQSGIGQQHRGIAMAGFIIGIVSLVLNVIGLIFYAIAIAAGAAGNV